MKEVLKISFLCYNYIEGSPYLPSIIYKGDDFMNKEIWKDIKDYEGLYQVSNLGRVKSMPRNTTKGRILKQSITYGYFRVRLSKNGRIKNYLVHRLVAQAFIKNTYNYDCINHKDENRLNNKVDNLEWCDYLYNNRYGTKPQKISKALTNNSKISKKVNQYDLNGRFIKTWDSIMEVQRKLKINNSNIVQCCLNKKYKTAGGFIWRYYDDIGKSN